MPARRLAILTYHRVLERPDPLRPDEPCAREFAAQMQVLSRYFNVLPLAEAVARLADGTLPRRAVAITFDDGYADNCEVALPILVRCGLPATFFVTSGFLDGGCMWNDVIIEVVRRTAGPLRLADFEAGQLLLETESQRVAAACAIIGRWKRLAPLERERRVAGLCASAGVGVPDDLMMQPEQVRSLHRHGMEIGAHTVRHPILASTDDAVAHREIVESKRRLESVIGAPVSLFAYPNGRPGRDYDARHVGMVRSIGFRAAVSTRPAMASAADDPLQLPRLAPWDRSPARFLLRLLAWHLAPRLTLPADTPAVLLDARADSGNVRTT